MLSRNHANPIRNPVKDFLAPANLSEYCWDQMEVYEESPIPHPQNPKNLRKNPENPPINLLVPLRDAELICWV